MGGKPYSASWLAKLLHSFPHRDLSFQKTESTFNPGLPVDSTNDEGRYRESLVFWAALPVLWLLLTLLVFLTYFCYRCCQKEPDKKRHGACLPWTMAVLAVITCAAVGDGFYGNEETNKGVLEFASSAEEAGDTITNMKQEVKELGLNINNTVNRGLLELQTKIEHDSRIKPTLRDDIDDLMETALRDTNSILTSVEMINTKAEKVNLTKAVYYTRQYGYYRWLGILILLCWLVALCLLLLLGIGRASKCTLLMFCAFGIFSLVLCWASAGLHLGVSVGLGDFCVAPDDFFEKLASEDIEKNIVRYYIKCQDEYPNPFFGSLRAVRDSVTSANTTLAGAVEMALQDLEWKDVEDYVVEVALGLDKTLVNLQQLTALVECTNLHKDYKQGLRGICSMALPGSVSLLLSAVVTGLLLTVLVLLASCAWRFFGKSQRVERKENTEVKGYYEIDEDDPFLPRADNASPSYYRYGSLPSRHMSVQEDSLSFTRGRHSNPREHMAMQRRSSPPPAYSTNEFYRQYNDMNSTPEDQRRELSSSNESHA